MEHKIHTWKAAMGDIPLLASLMGDLGISIYGAVCIMK